jgi:hypothetical protein
MYFMLIPDPNSAAQAQRIRNSQQDGDFLGMRDHSSKSRYSLLLQMRSQRSLSSVYHSRLLFDDIFWELY